MLARAIEARWEGPAAALPAFDAFMQYDGLAREIDGAPVTVQEWVRARLALPGVESEPVTELTELVQALCVDLVDRVEAVELARRAGLPERRLPPAPPADILDTHGDWGAYSTPARDARIRARFLLAIVPALEEAWRAAASAPSCRLDYRNSQGVVVTLTLDDVLDRLFAMSFDPYHCPERRWGAPEGSAEMATCPEDALRDERYRSERRARLRMNRDKYDSLTSWVGHWSQAPSPRSRRCGR